MLCRAIFIVAFFPGLALAQAHQPYAGLHQRAVEQRSAIQASIDAMKAETIPIGEKIVAKESELDRQFSSRAITPASLEAITSEIGALQGQLREAHLKYHLSTAALLTADQIDRYAELRGYLKLPDHHTPRH